MLSEIVLLSRFYICIDKYFDFVYTLDMVVTTETLVIY